MALFFKTNYTGGTGRRLTGFARYTELLERDFKRFFMVNLLTVLGFLPFGLGILFSILSSSILLLIPSCIIGGAIAGPALSCMYDVIFRSLRDAPGKWMDNYKRALSQNWRQSILPGILFCLLTGFYIFMLMLFWWASRFPGYGTLAVYLAGLILVSTFFTVYWPQLILFDQTNFQRFKNCILFIIEFFWKTLGCAALQLLYWVILFLLLPWSVLVLLLLGFWFILLTSNFLLYHTFDAIFEIEKQIAEQFPEQAAFYEDDAQWLDRKQKESR